MGTGMEGMSTESWGTDTLDLPISKMVIFFIANC